MIIAIHAVTAVYDASTFDPNVRVQASQPISYKCGSCPFSGNLEQGVEHAVKNQFIVREPKEND